MRPDAPGARLEWLVFSKEARTWVAADLACTDGSGILPLSAAATTALTAAATMRAAAPCPPPVAPRWEG